MELGCCRKAERMSVFQRLHPSGGGGRAEEKNTAEQELAWSQALFVLPPTWSFVRMHAPKFIKTGTTALHARKHTCLNHVSIPSLRMKYRFCSFVLKPPLFHIQSWSCACASLSMHAHRTRVNSMLCWVRDRVACAFVWTCCVGNNKLVLLRPARFF